VSSAARARSSRAVSRAANLPAGAAAGGPAPPAAPPLAPPPPPAARWMTPQSVAVRSGPSSASFSLSLWPKSAGDAHPFESSMTNSARVLSPTPRWFSSSLATCGGGAPGRGGEGGAGRAPPMGGAGDAAAGPAYPPRGGGVTDERGAWTPETSGFGEEVAWGRRSGARKRVLLGESRRRDARLPAGRGAWAHLGDEPKELELVERGRHGREGGLRGSYAGVPRESFSRCGGSAHKGAVLGVMVPKPRPRLWEGAGAAEASRVPRPPAPRTRCPAAVGRGESASGTPCGHDRPPLAAGGLRAPLAIGTAAFPRILPPPAARIPREGSAQVASRPRSGPRLRTFREKWPETRSFSRRSSGAWTASRSGWPPSSARSEPARRGRRDRGPGPRPPRPPRPPPPRPPWAP